MSPLDRAIARQRAELLQLERRAAAQIVDAYQQVAKRLQSDLDALTRQIADATAAGVEVRPGWLYSQARYRTLIGQLQQHTLTFLHRTLATVQSAQQLALEQVAPNVRDLTMLALGPAPKYATAQVLDHLTRLPTGALDALVGRASDGRPLSDLLAQLGADSAERVKNALAYGVATGKHPTLIAREVSTSSGMTLARALNISRTEMLGSYRQASIDSYQRSGIVTGWYWLAHIDARTCAACIAMSGSFHTVDETLDSHPSCRCTAIPGVRSWGELGFRGIPDRRPTLQPGAAVFAKLPEADKLAILGRAKLEAYDTGRISLQDLVHRTHSQRWGPGLREASLREALAHA